VRRKLDADSPVSETPTVFAEREDLSLREARRRWAELLRKVFEVDPLKCPGCGGEMRIISFITQQNLIDQILGHIQARGSRGTVARAPPVRVARWCPIQPRDSIALATGGGLKCLSLQR
jgi:hypothetical protein